MDDKEQTRLAFNFLLPIANRAPLNNQGAVR
jgi:hypothetical protein